MTPAATSGTKRPFPRLIVLTDLSRAGIPETVARFETLASAARPGSLMVQLRDKERPARERLALGRALSEICWRSGQLLQVNDRLDLAVLLRAGAVHLGEAAVATTDARRVVGNDPIVTRACHDVTSVTEVDADGIVLSPILAPRKGKTALGLEALQNARERLDLAGRTGVRLVALGGVDGGGIRGCFDAGADAVAVLGGWLTDRPMKGLLEGLGGA